MYGVPGGGGWPWHALRSERDTLALLLAVNQQEIEALYKRFRALDRGHKGFITAEEFLAIPELSINPLAKRVAYLCESINFREFVLMLAPYSKHASREDKLRHMFTIYDIDGELIGEQRNAAERWAGGWAVRRGL